MSWARVDDKLHGNEKFADVGLEATGLWLFCLAWCADNLTDGKLSESIISRLGGAKAKTLTKKLVDAQLWENRDGELWVHNYLKYNPSRAEVEAERNAAKERMKAVRSAKNAPSSGEQKRLLQDSSQNVRANNSRTSDEVRLTPTRPDPTLCLSSTDRQKTASKTPVSEPEKGSSSVSQFISETLSANPHWQKAYDEKVTNNAEVRNKQMFGNKLLKNWLSGDGTPPKPPPERVPYRDPRFIGKPRNHRKDPLDIDFSDIPGGAA